MLDAFYSQPNFQSYIENLPPQQRVILYFLEARKEGYTEKDANRLAKLHMTSWILRQRIGALKQLPDNDCAEKIHKIQKARLRALEEITEISDRKCNFILEDGQIQNSLCL